MDKRISEEKIRELFVALYPTGFPRREIEKAIKEVKDIYPTANNESVVKIAKEFTK